MLSKLFQKSPTGPVEFIIAGLGNPGAQYQRSRHNVGYWAVETISLAIDAPIKRIRFKSLCGEGVLNGRRVLLLKPTTYMNLSGQAVCEALRFYKLPPERALILFDDATLDVGRLRIRQKGSDGGHNGMKNIIYLSGSDAFPRIKIGVGQKPHPDYDLADWVLASPTQADIKKLEELMRDIPEAAGLIAQGKITDAMNRFNR